MSTLSEGFPHAVAGRERFRRANRLRRRREFERVSRAGRRRSSQYFVVLVARDPRQPGSSAGGRLGVTVSRKVGNAVVRNRVKRRIREWYRRRESAGSGGETVVIARRSAAGLAGREVAVELERLLAAVEAARC